jgi:hypothetical protein
MSEYSYICFCRQCDWEEVVEEDSKENAVEKATKVQDAHWVATGHQEIFHLGEYE